VAAIENFQLAGTKSDGESERPQSKPIKPNRRKFETAIQDLQGKISSTTIPSLAVNQRTMRRRCSGIQFAEQNPRQRRQKSRGLSIPKRKGCESS